MGSLRSALRRRLTWLAFASLAAPAAAAGAAPPAGALDAAVRDMCHRDVALLGEADHGDGATVAFKVALVRALVTRCHFGAVFFEANHYDFIDFQRRLREGRPAGPEAWPRSRSRTTSPPSSPPSCRPAGARPAPRRCAGAPTMSTAPAIP